VQTLILKLVMTPALIAIASLAGRRWGPGISGWLVGIPFTSGPIVLLLALDQGRSFATIAATGTMAGAISQAAFCVAYARLAHVSAVRALGAGAIAFAASTLAFDRLFDRLPVSLLPLFAMTIACLGIALRAMPGTVLRASAPSPRRPRGDLVAGMALATTFVLFLTGLAPTLGPRLTGLLAPFPVYAAVLAIFAHRIEGPAAAVTVLRGLLLGLFSFAGFFLVVAALLEPTGVAAAFSAAVAAAAALQGASLWILRRRLPKRGESAHILRPGP
jgi:hypothetical protein